MIIIGPDPFVVNINKITKKNDYFRTVLWTGNHLQLTLMSIPVRGEIGLERHPNLDQFIRIEEGQGLVKMGDRKEFLDFQKRVCDDFAFIIPAGKWHNLINTGNIPIKLYSIYAPPEHPHGTNQVTEEEKSATGLDIKLSLEDMLTYAIQAAYLARAKYFLAIGKFGQQRPFGNLLNAEENHIRYLIPLFKKYHVVVPTDNFKYYLKEPRNIKECLNEGVKGETDNIEMYDKFLNQKIPSDVKTVFILLRNASQNHLLVLDRILSF